MGPTLLATIAVRGLLEAVFDSMARQGGLFELSSLFAEPNTEIASGKDQTDLVDVLFALTSFETFDALSIRRRSDNAVEALIQQLVDDLLKRFSARRLPDGA